MPPPDRPALRRRLGDLQRRLAQILASLNTSLPTFAGVVYRMRTRCGKPRCVCREDQPHVAWCVSYREGKRRRLRTVPPEVLGQLRSLAQRYRRLRRSRAQMNQTFAQMMGVFDRLEESLRVPPSRALRGRPKRRP